MKIKKQNEIERSYLEIINKKEEEIKKLIEEKNKLNEILGKNKEELDKINNKVNIIEYKEKELKSIRDDIGIINIIDVEKLFKIKHKFSTSSLSSQRLDGIIIIGKKKSKKIKDEIQEEKEKVIKKKKKKPKEESTKDGEDSENIKLCSKEKKSKMKI